MAEINKWGISKDSPNYDEWMPEKNYIPDGEDYMRSPKEGETVPEWRLKPLVFQEPPSPVGATTMGATVLEEITSATSMRELRFLKRKHNFPAREWKRIKVAFEEKTAKQGPLIDPFCDGSDEEPPMRSFSLEMMISNIYEPMALGELWSSEPQVYKAYKFLEIELGCSFDVAKESIIKREGTETELFSLLPKQQPNERARSCLFSDTCQGIAYQCQIDESARLIFVVCHICRRSREISTCLLRGDVSYSDIADLRGSAQLAYLFYRTHSWMFLYGTREKRWKRFIIDTGLWVDWEQMEMQNIVRTWFLESTDRLLEQYSNDSELKSTVQSWQNKIENQASLVKIVVGLLQERRDMQKGEGFFGVSNLTELFQPKILQFHCRNGVFRFDEAKFYPRSPEDYAIQYAEYDYIPNANPRQFIQTVKDIFYTGSPDDKDMFDWFIRTIAFPLTGKISAKQFYIWTGAVEGQGNNGKSMLVNVLKQVLGPYATEAEPEVLVSAGKRQAGAASAHLSALKDKRLVYVNELNASDRFGANMKKLMDDDTIICRPLYGAQQQIVNMITFFLLTNYLPKPESKEDQAAFSRMVLVPFPNSFTSTPDRNNPRERQSRTDLSTVLKNEAAEILSFLLDEIVAWRKVFPNQEWSQMVLTHVPQRIKIANRQLQMRSGTVQGFLDVAIDSWGTEDSQIRASELYQAYVQFAQAFEEHPVSNSMFGTLVKKGRKAYVRRTERGNVYLCRFKEPFQTALATEDFNYLL